MFIIFSTLTKFESFRGVKSSFGIFLTIQNAFGYYMENNNYLLCLHTIAKYMDLNCLQARYACFTLLRLYHSCIQWTSERAMQFLIDTQGELDDLVNQDYDTPTQQIPAHICVVETMARALYNLVVGQQSAGAPRVDACLLR